MGGGVSSSTNNYPMPPHPQTATMSALGNEVLMISGDISLRRRLLRPRRIFFCHSCLQFSYELGNDDIFANGSTMTQCPRPTCRIAGSGLLESIPPSLRGSLRMEEIMIDVLVMRMTSAFSRYSYQQAEAARSQRAVSIMDLVLGTDVISVDEIEGKEEMMCTICNDSICSSPSSSSSSSISESTNLQHQQQQPAPQEDSQCIQLKKCRHVYHRACIMQWLLSKRSCPCCRAEIELHKATPSVENLIIDFTPDELTRKISYTESIRNKMTTSSSSKKNHSGSDSMSVNRKVSAAEGDEGKAIGDHEGLARKLYSMLQQIERDGKTEQEPGAVQYSSV